VPTKARKRWAEELQTTKCLTIALSCAIVGLSRCAYYYQSKLQDDSRLFQYSIRLSTSIYVGVFLNVLTASESLVINGIGYIKRFNRIYRTEVLDLYLFNNLKQVRKITEEWLTIYNTEFPHEALNNITPIKYKTLKHSQ
jgi:hypothetical protein